MIYIVCVGGGDSVEFIYCVRCSQKRIILALSGGFDRQRSPKIKKITRIYNIYIYIYITGAMSRQCQRRLFPRPFNRNLLGELATYIYHMYGHNVWCRNMGVSGAVYPPTLPMYYIIMMHYNTALPNFFTAHNDFAAFVLARPTRTERRAFSCTTSLSLCERSLHEEINFADDKDIDTSDRAVYGQGLERV